MMDEILKIIKRNRKVYIIHPDTYNKFTDWQKNFLETQGEIFLCSYVEPTEIYISKAASLLNPTIDCWEEV